jgi:3',5'-cyclic AMP phosphodiesterase CpdA
MCPYQMFILGHLSDIHLAPVPRPAFHQLMSKRALGYLNWRQRRMRHRREVLDCLVDDLLAQGPDHIAMTGDLVNIALPEEFRVVRRWLDKTGGPEMITVIPGNHDAYVPFLRNPGIRQWEPYMLANETGLRFGDHHHHAFPFVRLFGDIALVCLSSARATMPGMASGRLGRGQMQRAAALLEQLGEEGYCRIVLIHHPPLPGMTDWYRALHDARAFGKVLSDHGAELVLHGHNHRVMMTGLEGRSGPIPIIGAPSASVASAEPAKRAGYNLFTIDRDGDGPWRISMKSRSFDLDGQPTEINQNLLP